MKYDWYQSDSLVTISVMTKNCKEEELSIVFNEQEVSYHKVYSTYVRFFN